MARSMESLLGARAPIVAMVVMFASSAAWGQAQPPVRPTLDSNGVDLFRGTLQLATTDLTIGPPGNGGLSFGRTFYPGGWRVSGLGVIRGSGNIYTVSVGDHAETFTFEAGEYSSNEGQGARLFGDSVGWVLETKDGTQISFKDRSATCDEAGALGFIESIITP